jgi:SAM-dependent methyltransferase
VSTVVSSLGEVHGTQARQAQCASCGAPDLAPFYRVEGAPVHSVLLMPARDIAVGFPRADIELAVCTRCGFISNVLFDPTLHSYSANYEETQGFSATFREFHRSLALSLIETFDLRGKRVIEIGCGKGEFLALLAELGNNEGVGFDPAFVAARNPTSRAGVRFVADFYSEKYADEKADFVCCKMTLEHIANTEEFVSTVRRSIAGRRDCIVFFQVPDMSRVLRDLAFWDVYYEHCSYFTAGSLRRLFERCGFEVLNTTTEYEGQYLTITAKPATMRLLKTPASQSEIDLLLAETQNFSRRCGEGISAWRNCLKEFGEAGKKVVIWGSGSKGVAFLTALGAAAQIDYVVDINPHRQGKFMAGTGQEIVAPEFLESYRPDVAIAMNPIYKQEIQKDLNRMSLETRILTV